MAGTQGATDTLVLGGFDQRRDELLQLVTALIGKRVSTGSAVATGATTASAPRLVADALAIQREMDKQMPQP